jgi:hypothetical protein
MIIIIFFADDCCLGTEALKAETWIIAFRCHIKAPGARRTAALMID